MLLRRVLTHDHTTLEDEGKLHKGAANCYVIWLQDYYSLPLVYGNAITNGTTNRSAIPPQHRHQHLKFFHQPLRSRHHGTKPPYALIVLVLYGIGTKKDLLTNVQWIQVINDFALR